MHCPILAQSNYNMFNDKQSNYYIPNDYDFQNCISNLTIL